MLGYAKSGFVLIVQLLIESGGLFVNSGSSPKMPALGAAVDRSREHSLSIARRRLKVATILSKQHLHRLVSLSTDMILRSRCCGS